MPDTAQTGSQFYKVEVIAQLFGLTVRRIQQLTQDGVLHTDVAPDGKRRYDLVPTIQAYIKYLSEKAYGKSRNEKESELREQKMKAEIALKESQGELHRLKTEIAVGKYIEVEEVKLDYQRFFSVFKKFAMSLPPRLVDLVSGYLEPLEARRIEKELQAEVRANLTGFVVAGLTPEEMEAGGRRKKAPVSQVSG